MADDVKLKKNPMFKDLTGLRFGRFLVAGEAGRNSGKHATWRCVCDCGEERIVVGYHLRRGSTASCGCLQRDLASVRQKKHGLTKSPEYQAWRAMLKRCSEPRHSKNYSERGIAVCDRWQNEFEAFYADMGRRPSVEHSLDRIDNDKGYSPDNCRWATAKDQSRNRRSNRIVEFRGQRMALVEAVEIAGISYHRAWFRLRRGMSVEDALRP